MGNSMIRVVRSGPVAEIVLSRPERRNALDAATGWALVQALDDIRQCPQTRSVILRGEGRSFCAGGDLKDIAHAVRHGDSKNHLREIAEAVHTAVARIVRLPKPVIASVHGQAHGAGFSLALACDLIVAADDATFCQAFVKVGTSPDSGSTYFLPRLIGRHRAAELILLGETISAIEAHRLGLINRVVPHTDLHAQVRALAERLARGPAQAHARAKQLIATSEEVSLEQQLAVEQRLLSECAATDDFREGIEAFLAKRPPVFTAAGLPAGLPTPAPQTRR